MQPVRRKMLSALLRLNNFRLHLGVLPGRSVHSSKVLEFGQNKLGENRLLEDENGRDKVCLKTSYLQIVCFA